MFECGFVRASAGKNDMRDSTKPKKSVNDYTQAHTQSLQVCPLHAVHHDDFIQHQ